MHQRHPPSRDPPPHEPVEARGARNERSSRGALGALRELGLDLLALLWPTVCVGCGRPDRDLCDPCRREVDGRSERGPILSIDGLGVPGYAATRYEGPTRGALLAYKHRGAYGFVRPLGRHLARVLAHALGGAAGRAEASAEGPAEGRAEGPAEGRAERLSVCPSEIPCEIPSERPAAARPRAPVVVPLPSRRRRVRERGWKHVDELVRVALRTRPHPPGALLAGPSPTGASPADPRPPDPRSPDPRPLAVVAALRTLRGRTGQVGLDQAGRERNARRIAVRAKAARLLNGREVILVDDIVTTGATARAAIAALEREGARVVAVVALCVAPRRDAPQKTEWNLTGERG